MFEFMCFLCTTCMVVMTGFATVMFIIYLKSRKEK